MRKSILCIVLCLAAAGASAVELTTDKPSYAFGERVVFTLTNDDFDWVFWSSQSLYPTVWRITATGEEELVYDTPGIGVGAIGQIRRGEDASWTWDQRTYHELNHVSQPRLPVAPGLYVGRFRVSEAGHLVTDVFTIDALPAVDLTTDRPAYGFGETVGFTLTNHVQDRVGWAVGDYPTVWRIAENGDEELVYDTPPLMLPPSTSWAGATTSGGSGTNAHLRRRAAIHRSASPWVLGATWRDWARWNPELSSRTYSRSAPRYGSGVPPAFRSVEIL